MEHYIKTGVGFGLTSATITTLALMIGLYASTESRLAVLSGILIIAIADAMSDAFAIHITEESREGVTQRAVWAATGATFFSKLIFALIFVVPVIFFSLFNALIVNTILGLIMLATLSVLIAKNKKESAARVVTEHLLLAALVVGGSYYLGEMIRKLVN